MVQRAHPLLWVILELGQPYSVASYWGKVDGTWYLCIDLSLVEGCSREGDLTISSWSLQLRASSRQGTNWQQSTASTPRSWEKEHVSPEGGYLCSVPWRPPHVFCQNSSPFYCIALPSTHVASTPWPKVAFEGSRNSSLILAGGKTEKLIQPWMRLSVWWQGYVEVPFWCLLVCEEYKAKWLGWELGKEAWEKGRYKTLVSEWQNSFLGNQKISGCHWEALWNLWWWILKRRPINPCMQQQKLILTILWKKRHLMEGYENFTELIATVRDQENSEGLDRKN